MKDGGYERVAVKMISQELLSSGTTRGAGLHEGRLGSVLYFNISDLSALRGYEKPKLDTSSHCGWFDIMSGDLLSEDNGFLDEAFDNKREIGREPSIDPTFERATLVIPLARSSSATRALVASLGHEE